MRAVVYVQGHTSQETEWRESDDMKERGREGMDGGRERGRRRRTRESERVSERVSE